MHRWLDYAFSIMRREIPGQWNRLRGYMEQAPPDVQEEFYRVMQAFESEVDREKRRARQPWRRF